MIDRRFVVLGLLLGMAACGGDEGEDVVVAGDSITAESATQPAGGMDQPPGGMGQTAQFAALNNSGIGGEATVTDRGAESEILVRLTGAAPNSSHPGHVHSGTCAAIGSVVQPLQEITVDATGTGTTTSTVTIAPMTLADGQHVIVYHGDGGAPATCAQIPAHTM